MKGIIKKRIYFEDPYSFEWTYLTNKEMENRWHGIEKGKRIIKHGIAVFGKESVFSSKKIIHMRQEKINFLEIYQS